MVEEWVAATDIHYKFLLPHLGKELVVVKNMLAIPKQFVAIDYKFKQRFLLSNPYYTGISAAETDYLPDLKKAEYIRFYLLKGNHLFIPLYAPIKDLIIKKPAKVIDARLTEPSIPHITFEGELRDYQQQAVTEWWKKKCGIIQARTGSGKTIIALYLIAHSKKKTLVLVHTKLLQEQWLNTAKRFLNGAKIITTQKKDLDDDMDILIATYQWFFNRMKQKAQLMQKFPFLVADEVHRVSAPMFFRTVLLSPARYRLGLTATPFRTDGLFPMSHWLLGKPLITATDPTLWHANVYVIDTQCSYPSTSFLSDTRKQIAHLKSRISKDNERIRKLLDIILTLYRQGRYIIVAVPTRRMVDTLYDLLIQQDNVNPIDIGAIHSKRNKKDRQEIKTKQVIIATTEIIMEGFDLPRLDCLINAAPFASKLLHVQIIGRILRHATEKQKPIIIDLFDHDKDGILEGLMKKRMRTYREEGHDIMGIFNVSEFIDTISKRSVGPALLPEDEVL